MKNQKGITMIVLIITIIVMLILVGIALRISVNEEGVVTKTEEALNEQERTEIMEKIGVAMLYNSNGTIKVLETYKNIKEAFGEENVILIEPENEEDIVDYAYFKIIGQRVSFEYTLNGEGVKEEEPIEPPKLNSTNVLETNYGMLIESGGKVNKIKIPKGFGIVDTSTEAEVLIEDSSKYNKYIKSNIDNGIVIRDNDGNEFVWIPVENPVLDLSQTTLQTPPDSSSDKYWNAISAEIRNRIIISDNTKYPMAAKLPDGNYVGILYTFSEENGKITGIQEDKYCYREPNNLVMTTRVYQYQLDGKGDYVQGDYSFDSEQCFAAFGGGSYDTGMYQREYNEMVEKVVSAGGFFVGRYETGGFNKDKVIVKKGEGNYSIKRATWHKMYRMQKEFGNEDIGSSMIWGSQFDQVMNFVNGKLDAGNQIFNVGSKESRGLQQDTNTLTGNTVKDKVANIYDLGGNVSENTLQGITVGYRQSRGRRFNSPDWSPSQRTSTYPDSYSSSEYLR